MKFEIKSRWSGSVLFSLETDSLKLCVEAAVKAKAYLGDADLRGADLRGADLRGADLRGADGEKLTLVGGRPLLIIGPIGSREDWLHAFITDRGVYVKTGCFFGTLGEFTAAVSKEHKGNNHATEYTSAISLIEAHAELWMPKEAKKEGAA